MGRNNCRGKFGKWIGVSCNAMHRGISYFEAFGEYSINEIISQEIERQRAQLKKVTSLEILAELQDYLLEEANNGALKNWDRRDVKSIISFILYR
nr:MAG TPA: hypothetical protein [Caudoviricetes sp.]